MCSSKTLMFIGAGLLFLLALPIIVVGFFYVWGSASTSGQASWAGIGLATTCLGLMIIAGGIALIWLATRSRSGAATQNVTLKVDLPGDVNLDTMKCKSCGGALTMDNIQMVAGAPVVSCPYCKTTYQLTEEPKW